MEITSSNRPCSKCGDQKIQIPLYYCGEHKALFTAESAERFEFKCSIISINCPKCKSLLFISAQSVNSHFEYALQCSNCIYHSDKVFPSLDALYLNIRSQFISSTAKNVRLTNCNLPLKNLYTISVCPSCISRHISRQTMVPYSDLINLLPNGNYNVSKDAIVTYILLDLIKKGVLHGMISEESKVFYSIPGESIIHLKKAMQSSSNIINYTEPSDYQIPRSNFKGIIQSINEEEKLGIAGDTAFYPYPFILNSIHSIMAMNKVSFKTLAGTMGISEELIREIIHTMETDGKISGFSLSNDAEYISESGMEISVTDYLSKHPQATLSELIKEYSISVADGRRFSNLLSRIIQGSFGIEKEERESTPIEASRETLSLPTFDEALIVINHQLSDLEYSATISNKSEEKLRSPRIILRLPHPPFLHNSEIVDIHDLATGAETKVTTNLTGFGKPQGSSPLTLSALFLCSIPQGTISMELGELAIQIPNLPSFSKESLRFFIQGKTEASQPVMVYNLNYDTIVKIIRKINTAYCLHSFYSEQGANFESWGRGSLLGDFVLRLEYTEESSVISITMYSAGDPAQELMRIISMINSEIVERLTQMKEAHDSNYNIYMLTNNLITLSDFLHLNHGDIVDITLKLEDIIERLQVIDSIKLPLCESEDIITIMGKLLVEITQSKQIGQNSKKALLDTIDVILAALNKQLKNM